jgi:hypothetical protein
MPYHPIIDLRDLATEWRDVLDALDPEAHDLPLTADERAEIEQQCKSFEDLCAELGIDPSPDALQWIGENEEPTMIAESYFKEYAQELADDLGLIDAAVWPLTCIDWEHAAKELRYDYTGVTYDGTDYLIRLT